MKKILFPLLLSLLLCLTAACGAAPDVQTPDASTPDSAQEGEDVAALPQPGAEVQKGDLAWDFTITRTDGTEFTLSEQRGKPVLINFWATWCPICIEEMPVFDALWEKYGDDLVILAVGCDEDESLGQAYLDEQGFSFPTALDPELNLLALYPTDGLPYTLVIDREGVVDQIMLSGGPANTMEGVYSRMIDSVLAK